MIMNVFIPKIVHFIVCVLQPNKKKQKKKKKIPWPEGKPFLWQLATGEKIIEDASAWG